MILAVVGSRTFEDAYLVFRVLITYPISHIISGGARGADTLAIDYAEAMNIPYTIYPADWDKYGRSAGFIRNKDIVDNSDQVLAFWDGISKGTQHTLVYARKQNKLLHIEMV